MKYEFDGFAFTPKFCCKCGKKFIFEPYKRVHRIITPKCTGYDYYCKECYSK